MSARGVDAWQILRDRLQPLRKNLPPRPGGKLPDSPRPSRDRKSADMYASWARWPPPSATKSLMGARTDDSNPLSR